MQNIEDTEKTLKELTPKSMPQWLKKRILFNTKQRKQEFRVLSPAYRILLSWSCFLFLAVLLSEPIVQKYQSRTLTSIMNGSQTSKTQLEKNLKAVTQDIMQIKNAPEFNNWWARHYIIHRKEKKFGRSRYQNIMTILKEELNGV